MDTKSCDLLCACACHQAKNPVPRNGKSCTVDIKQLILAVNFEFWCPCNFQDCKILFVSFYILFVCKSRPVASDVGETLVHWKLKWNRNRRRQSNKRCIMESEKCFVHNFLVKMNNAGLCLVVLGADSIQTWNLCALHPRAIKECQILGDSASVTVSQCHSVTLHNWRKYCDTAHFKIQLAHNSQPHHMCTDNTLLSDKNWPPFCGFITIHHKGSRQKKTSENLGPLT